MVGARQVGVVGLLLVGLLTASFAINSGGEVGAPEADRGDATILDWYTDSGTQVRVLLAWMIGGLLVLASLSLLAFPGFGINGYLPVVWVLLVSIVRHRRRFEPALETRAQASHNP